MEPLASSLPAGWESGVADVTRFRRAVSEFDALNATDPNLETCSDGTVRPKELVYAERLSIWVLRLCPDASEPLKLASRCQHLCRWQIPRDRYPADRAGYHRWRTDLKEFHATQSAAVLTAARYPDGVVVRVQALNRKENLAADAEMQVLEDALCLVFLEYQLAELATRSEQSKLVNAIRKSWLKMTPRGRECALALQLPASARRLVELALP